jgi:hypothetical protein
MKEIKIQTCLANFKTEIYAQMAKEDPLGLLSYFKIADKSLLEAWLSGQKIPAGLRLIKMAYYLYERHFLTIDFDQNEEAIIGAIKILALGIATPRVATSHIGYKDESDLYRVLLGKANYSRKSFLAIKSFVEMHKDKTTSPKVVETTKQNLHVALSSTVCTNQDQLLIDLVHTIGSISVCLEPLLKNLVEASPNERQAFRNSLGKDERGVFQISNVFFRVSDLMNAMCSEKSVETYKNKTKKRR